VAIGEEGKLGEGKRHLSGAVIRKFLGGGRQGLKLKRVMWTADKRVKMKLSKQNEGSWGRKRSKLKEDEEKNREKHKKRGKRITMIGAFFRDLKRPQREHL